MLGDVLWLSHVLRQQSQLELCRLSLFSQPRTRRCSGTLVPCIRSHASHFVTGQMVGDRHLSGAKILGGEFFLLLPANHPVSVPPTGCVYRDPFWCGQCTGWQVLYVQTGSFPVCIVLVLRCGVPRSPAVAAAAVLCVSTMHADRLPSFAAHLGHSSSAGQLQLLFFASCSSATRAPSREPSNKLGSKKQRFVNTMTDAWLATAGLRGRRNNGRRAVLLAPPPTLSSRLPPLPLQSSRQREGVGWH